MKTVELLDLLREARVSVQFHIGLLAWSNNHSPLKTDELAKTEKTLNDIDSALAERQDSATSVEEFEKVGWRRMNGQAFMSAYVNRCDVDLFQKLTHGWMWQVRSNGPDHPVRTVSGDANTLAQAKEAAVNVARSLR